MNQSVYRSSGVIPQPDIDICVSTCATYTFIHNS